jgi:hypothetical protein
MELPKLREIGDPLKVSGAIPRFGAIGGLPVLEKVWLYGVDRDVNLANLPSLSVESVRFAVENSDNGESSVTLSVSQGVFDVIPADIADMAKERNIVLAVGEVSDVVLEPDSGYHCSCHDGDIDWIDRTELDEAIKNHETLISESVAGADDDDIRNAADEIFKN